MTLLLNSINFKITMLSPLDQFGSDGMLDFFDILFFILVIENFDVLNILDIFDVSIWQSLVSGLLSTYFYEDDDCSESEWEDNNANIATIQSSIFISNASGMIPGFETSTSEASLTFFFSISTMVTLILIGFSLHGVRYFSILLPSGTPLIMAPFIILIEFVSFIARAVSLGMRLFANMFAGHSLVKILMSFAWLFLTSALPFLSLPVFILLFIIFLMELGIAYLQSYVFGALSSMYFEDTISLGH